MVTNPYESPQPAPEERPALASPPREKSLIWLLVLVVATFGGGLTGNYLGNQVAGILGMLPEHIWRHYSLFYILHPVGLVMLVAGSLAAAYAVLRISDHSVTQQTVYKE